MKEVFKTYQDILVSELEKRKKRNRSYSLSAYARDLGLTAGSLSRVFSGQQGISPEKSIEIVKVLNLSAEESQFFCTLVKANHARSKKVRESALKELKSQDQESLQLSIDRFQVISDWHYFAILELTTLKEFQSRPEWIANRLNISIDLAQDGLTRLLNLGLLKNEKKSSLKLTKTNALLVVDGGGSAVKKRHTQILEKAIQSIDLPKEERDYTSITFSLSSRDVGWAKNEIQKFRRALAKKMTSTKDLDRVYNFSTQLFPLDQKMNHKKRKEIP